MGRARAGRDGRLPGAPPLAAALLVLALGACTAWKPAGNACVRESRDPELRRVVNYTDPELCGRSVQHRSGVYLRVPRPKAG